MADCPTTCKNIYLAEIAAAINQWNADYQACGGSIDCQVDVGVALTARLVAARAAYDQCILDCNGGGEG